MRNGFGIDKKSLDHYSYEGAFIHDQRHGYGVLKHLILTEDNQSKYVEYSGNFVKDMFHGKGKLVIYSNRSKQLVLEHYEGSFSENLKKGVGRMVKIREGLDPEER